MAVDIDKEMMDRVKAMAAENGLNIDFSEAANAKEAMKLYKDTMAQQMASEAAAEKNTAKGAEEAAVEEVAAEEVNTAMPAVREGAAPAQQSKASAADNAEYVDFEEIVEEPKTQTAETAKVEEVVAEEVQAPETTLMPAVVNKQEKVAEEVNTVLPAVRNGTENSALKTNSASQRAANDLTDKEKQMALDFMSYASFLSVPNSGSEQANAEGQKLQEAFTRDVAAVLRDYASTGITPADSQRLISEVLALASKEAAANGTASPEVLKALEAHTKETLNKLYSQTAPAKETTALNEAPANASVKMLDENEEEKAARKKAEAEKEAAEKAAKEKAAKEAAEKAAKEKAAAEAQAAQTTNTENTTGDNVGTFSAAENDSADKEKNKKENKDNTAAPVIETDLLKQLKNVAMLNRYYGFEAEKDTPPRKSPFQAVTKAAKSPAGVKPPYASAELSSGAKLFNRPNSVDMIYKTRLTQDGEEKTQLSFEDCMTMVRLGQQKGWTAAKLTGPREFQEQMYLACRAMGMPVKDFQPSPELQELGDKKEKEHQATREHVKSLDARFPQMEAERAAKKLSYNDVDYEFMDQLKEKGLGLPKAERKKDEKDNEKAPKKESEKEEKPKSKGRTRKEKAEKVVETAVADKIKADAKAEEVQGGPVKPAEAIAAETKAETQKLLAAANGPAEVLQSAGQKMIEAKETKVKTDLTQQRMLALPEKTATKDSQTETRALPAVISKEITDRAAAKR